MPNATTPADPSFQPPPGTTLNEYGFWVTPEGDLARTATGDYQRTPGAIANNAHQGTDERGIGWMSNNATGGDKSFLSPYSRGIYNDPHDHDGGFFRGNSRWNSKTGEFDKGDINWGNIMSLAVGGALAAPVVVGALGAGAGAGAASGAEAATTGVAASTGAIPGASLGMSAALPGAVSSVPALAGTGGGIMSALTSAKALKSGAQLAGSLGKSAAQNRSEQLAATMDASTLQNQREAENRAERTSAWRQLQQAEYMMNNKGYQPRAGLPTFGTTGVAPTDTMRQGASGMRDEVLKRLMGGKMQDPNYAEMAKPGGWEKLANIAGPALQYGSMFL